MRTFRDELQVLQLQMAHKKRLEAMLKELQTQKTLLDQKVGQLQKIKTEEQKDVDRLEGRSLAAFVYYISGKMDEKLDLERKEAYAARVRYDAAVQELTSITHDIQETEADLAALGDCDSRYRLLLEQKRDVIKAAGSPLSDTLLEQEKTIARLQQQEQELQEALAAGRAAVNITDDILNGLTTADGWSTLDLVGGGLLVDLAKHEILDEAQTSVEKLQVQLHRFNKELVDADIRTDLQVNIEDMLKFADYFFDNLLTDLTVLDRIRRSRSQVERTRSQILSILRQLNDKLEIIWYRLADTKKELDALIISAEVEP